MTVLHKSSNTGVEQPISTLTNSHLENIINEMALEIEKLKFFGKNVELIEKIEIAEKIKSVISKMHPYTFEACIRGLQIPKLRELFNRSEMVNGTN